jgi:hypothetical protein
VETKLRHFGDIAISSGLPESYVNPIKPELFAGKHEGRLGKLVGMTQFGVNHVTLDPGSMSSLRHWHEAEDEFVYVLAGKLLLIDENGEHELTAGSFAGFPRARRTRIIWRTCQMRRRRFLSSDRAGPKPKRSIIRTTESGRSRSSLVLLGR